MAKSSIDGRTVNHLPPQRRNVAMVFQNYALYPHKTVRQNLEFPLRMMKLPKAQQRERIAQVVEILGLTPWLDRLPKHLSGGQRQRVAMGRALVRNPAVFLLDEPLSNLDAKLRVQVRAEIAQLQRRMKTTSVYVTHDQVEAMTLGDRVAIMLDGRLQQIGSGRELYERPANVFVASFIGSPEMNVFHSQLRRREGDDFELELGGTWLPVSKEVVARYDCIEELLGARILAGLRPEAFSAAAAAAPSVGRLSVRVAASEALGHENVVYFESPARMHRSEKATEINGASQSPTGRFAARFTVPGLPPAVGHLIAVGVDTGQLVLFDRRGDALRLRQ